MDDAEYDEIQRAAEGRRLTVSHWVREVLRAARSGETHPNVPPPGTDPDLVRVVMERHALGSPTEAIDFALRRAAQAPLSRTDLLSLRGTGWPGPGGEPS